MTITTQYAPVSEIFTVGEKVWWVLTYSGFASKVTVTVVEENLVTVLTDGGALMKFPKTQPENPQELITHREPVAPELKPCPTYWEVSTDF